MPSGSTASPASQLPGGDALYLDHIGHFVADPEAAARAFQSMGFTTTPTSIQTNPDPAGGLPHLTGTGNVCVMLPMGYVEVLFKTAETPLAAEFDAARARYSGLHLVALATAKPAQTHARLDKAGFKMQPIVKMQRPVGTATGEGIAAFEVVRLAPGQMPEGRVQMLRHVTEETVWQPRWLTHANGARALRSLTIVVEDLDEAAARFGRFTGRTAQSHPMGAVIVLDRGEIVLSNETAWRERWPMIAPPSLPFMGECGIEVTNLPTIRSYVAAAGLALLTDLPDAISAAFPLALGNGVWTFSEAP